MITNCIRSFDAHPPAATQRAKGTIHGGLCTFIVVVLFLLFVVYYFAGVFVGTYSLVATTSILPFPDTSADADTFLLPPATCIAPTGCWSVNCRQAGRQTGSPSGRQ